MMDYNINELKRKMLIKYPFFGSIIANVDYVENESIKTAGTDGNKIYYSPSFMKKINNKQQIFVLAHEVCHIAFNHISRSKNKNIKIWNIAADGVINQFLLKDGLELVPGAVNIEDAINYNVEDLYDKLLKNIENQQTINNHDTHEMWISNNNSIQKETNISEKDIFAKNQQLRKEIIGKLKNETTKNVIKDGVNERNEIRKINDIPNEKQIIDWCFILKSELNYYIDWSYQHAEIIDGVITPNLEKFNLPQTEILLDTSGSINEILLRYFINQCKYILKYSYIKIGCFDDKFYGFIPIKTIKDINNMKFIGNGGTNFDVAINAFSKNAENKIIFTDGDAVMPAKRMDVIWIVYGKEKIKPLGGKVFYINPSLINISLVEKSKVFRKKI